eukprot:gene7714-2758_t
MGFVGYTSQKASQRAITSLNKAFLDGSKLTVETAKKVGDPSIQNVRSRITKTRIERRAKKNQSKEDDKNENEEDNGESSEEENEDHKENAKKAKLQEFLGVATKSNVPIWANDMHVEQSAGKSGKKKEEAAMAQSGDNDDDGAESSVAEMDEDDFEKKQEQLGDVSDMDFLNQMKGGNEKADDSGKDNRDEDDKPKSSREKFRDLLTH